MFIDSAWAQAASAAAKPSMMESMMPIIFLVAIFYFFLIRPQQKRAKTHQSFLSELKRGDEVLTSGGIFGKVEGLTDSFVTLGIADDVKIRILKTQIASTVNDGETQK